MTIRTVYTVVRKCGKRVANKAYAIGGESGSENGVLERFTRVCPPIPYQVKLHRGPRLVDATTVLYRAPMEEWWAGSSKETEVKKSGDAWAQDTFGMTEHRRITVGECTGATSSDEALAILVNKIGWNKRIVDFFRAMTLSDIQRIQRVAPHYLTLHDHLLAYTVTGKVGELMGAQAAIWRIAYNLPPSKRSEYIPNLMRILALMNLTKDALTMQRTFGG
jgi:hypothetical protein